MAAIDAVDSEITSTVSTGVNDTIVFTRGLDTPDAGASSVRVNEGNQIDEDEDEADVLVTFKDAAFAEFDMVWGATGDNAIQVDNNGVAYAPADVGDLASFLVPGAVITISAEGYEREITLAGNSRTDGMIEVVIGDAAATPSTDGDEIQVTASCPAM